MTQNYVELGQLIASSRTMMSLSQTEFAARLNLKQQSVSRWEAGTHRPSVDEIPKLAQLIGERPELVMRLAGYGKGVSASLTSQFPVDTLDAANFENFVRDVVKAKFPDATVDVQGGQGHNQGGTDVVATLADGRTIYSFQCKRHERFGNADAKKAIEYHSVDADKKYLVLSKVIAPALRKFIRTFPDWEVLDKADLTAEVRSLSFEMQERLVDIYFRGQRLALIGRDEPGPWLNIEEYFQPFRGRASIFTHDWALVGRDVEIGDTLAALDDDNTSATVLVGPGGIGKTRILKEVVQRYAAAHPKTTIRFLSTARDPGSTDLANLGTGKKLLVIDDAHDREGLKLLVEHAVRPDNRTSLLIATRPYALSRIRNDLALYNLLKQPTVTLDRMDKGDLKAIVLEALVHFEAAAEWADRIVQIAGDSPLVAAMAARVVAAEGRMPELVAGDADFRQVILTRFEKIILGDLGGPDDAKLLLKVMETIALIQPFHVDDARILQLVRMDLLSVSESDVERALKTLQDGGVIYKRGALFRLMPDLLGDFLIEKSCIGTDNKLTVHALNVAKALRDSRLTQVLVNLGRMDWRRMDGDPDQTKLLEPIWKTFQDIDEFYDGRVAAIEAVSYYQPKQSLDFVQEQLDRGRRLECFGPILRRVALSPEYRTEALSLLWELGNEDDGDLGRNFNHPVRILKDLLAFDDGKPLSFIEEVADFALGLFDRQDAWKGRHSPFDILVSVLRGEFTSTTSTGLSVTISPYVVNYQAVAHIRAKVIDAIFEQMRSSNMKASRRAATTLADALRPPSGMMGTSVPDELHAMFVEEFSITLDRVGDLLNERSLPVTTTAAIIKQIHWFARYDKGRTLGNKVRAMLSALPLDLKTRFRSGLAEAAEYEFVGQVPFEDWRDDRYNWVSALADEILDAYPDRDALIDTFLAYRQDVLSAGCTTVAGNQLMTALMSKDLGIARRVTERVLDAPENTLVVYLPIALGRLIDIQPRDGRALIAAALESVSPAIRVSGAQSLAGIDRELGQEDYDLIASALQSTDTQVVSMAVTVLRYRATVDKRRVIDLLLKVNLRAAPKLYDEVCGVFCGRDNDLVDSFRPGEIQQFLNSMLFVPELEGRWILTFLASLADAHGHELVTFILGRLQIELAVEDGSYSAVEYGFHQGQLALHSSPDAESVIRHAWEWLRLYGALERSEGYSIGKVFDAMFDTDSEVFVGFLSSLLETATTTDLRLIGDILRHGGHQFPFNHQDFVVRYLDRCRAVEQALVDDVVDKLLVAAQSGLYTGSLGEPTQRDLRVRDSARIALKSLSRTSAAYQLYRKLLKHADDNIARSIADRDAYDDG